MSVLCAHCSASLSQSVSAVNRAMRENRPLYCNRTCAGLARRTHKPTEQKKAEKRLYDARRRIELADQIKAAKQEYFRRTYDPVAAAAKRKENMPKHVEYCRQPQYKQYKQQYDQQHRAKKIYGEFYEAFLLALQIDEEVKSRASKMDIAIANGTLNKSQTRKREYERFNGSQS